MEKGRRVVFFRVAVLLASAGFLAACAVDPIEPTAASAAGPVESTPMSTTTHTMATDIAGPVDLGPEPATIKTAEIAGGLIQDASEAVHRATKPSA
jgi:hypothetical protein